MPTPPSSIILLLGAGELGTAVLHHLTTHPALNHNNTKITLLLRPSTVSDPTRQTLYSKSNLSLLPCDIATAPQSSLATIFADYETIIACNGMTLPPGTQLKLVRAVLEAASGTAESGNGAGLAKRYFPWQFGLDYDAIGRGGAQDLFDEQLDVRALLRGQSAVKWTIVSTGMFMSFLFEAAFGVVELGTKEGNGRVTALGSWENALTVTEVGDIGRVVAELALVDVGMDGVVFVAGDTVGMRRLAGLVEGMVGGREVEKRVKSVAELQGELAEEPVDGMRKYRAVFAAGVGVAWDREGSYNVRKGIDTMSVEEWAERNLRVLEA